MIGNAHLDPVWLWGKADGTDAALATARSACDRLDEYPDFVFTCSTLWFHEQVERADPALFERVRAFVEAGRWRPVGGMVVQPDCNLPAAESFRRHLAAGQAYYRERFGRATTVGYNVDSFGHCAYLPRFLREAGIDCYVFMRPGPHERPLPGGLFRWRSPDGSEVAAFRIRGAYAAGQADLREHVLAALEDLPEGIEQTMCFYGVGDHGGGPTRRQIEWIRQHAEAIGGARLVFSHPRAFFDAVAPQAERALDVLGGRTGAEARAALDAAWRKVLFNQFHDVLGGTCLPEASRLAAGELTAAESEAADVIAAVSRRALRAEARPGEHRIVVLNASEEAFDGWVRHEPWAAFAGEAPPCLLDEWGRAVPLQLVDSSAMVAGLNAGLFRVAVPAGKWRILHLAERPEGAAPGAAPDEAAGLRAADGHLANRWATLTADAEALRLNDWAIRLDVCDDPTDTWSHSAGSRFGEDVVGTVSWSPGAEAVENGPWRAAVRLSGGSDGCRVHCRAMLTADEPVLRLRLHVVWAQVRRRLRLRLACPAAVERRTDLVSGGPLARPIDGREYPLSGGLIAGGGARSLAVLAPEVFSAAVDREGVSLSLLRSPYAAHHDPAPPDARPDQPATDQGTHVLEVGLWPDCGWDLEPVARRVRAAWMPPIVWEMTG
jgi:alpha-mannosidase